MELNNNTLAACYLIDCLTDREPVPLNTIKASMPPEYRDQTERLLFRLERDGQVIKDAKGRYLLLPEGTKQEGLFSA